MADTAPSEKEKEERRKKAQLDWAKRLGGQAGKELGQAGGAAAGGFGQGFGFGRTLGVGSVGKMAQAAREGDIAGLAKGAGKMIARAAAMQLLSFIFYSVILPSIPFVVGLGMIGLVIVAVFGAVGSNGTV